MICLNCNFSFCEGCHSNIQQNTRCCPTCKEDSFQQKNLPPVPSAAEVFRYAEKGTNLAEIYEFISIVKSPYFQWTELFHEIVEKLKPSGEIRISLDETKQLNILFKLKRRGADLNAGNGKALKTAFASQNYELVKHLIE
jgi:hypothetical protein